jgi:predicted phage terminase large subunit-like protein
MKGATPVAVKSCDAQDGPKTEAVDPVEFLMVVARTNYAAFITAVHRPRYRHSAFSAKVCAEVDRFVDDLLAGKRPVLMLTAPPQSGKSSLISRCLGPYLFGRLAAELGQIRIACASYALKLARRNVRDAKGIMQGAAYRAIFPAASLIGHKGVNSSEEFDVPGGSHLQGVGVGGGLTGFSVDIALIDDSVKDAMQALSPDVQDNIEAWFESVVLTRMQERSGVVLIGTPWSANDLLARVRRKMEGDPRFTRLSFPALNRPDEIGYDPELPLGALVPQLHSEAKLLELKAHMSAVWWSSMYQQAPLAEFGAIFKREHVQYYRRADLPANFQTCVLSVDAAFKDGSASDYVGIGVWGKTADGKVWLVDWRREKLSFMATASAIVDLKRKHPRVTRTLIEDAANGPALISMLSRHIPGLVGVPPLGSKEARAHAVSWVWQNKCVMLPHPEDSPGIAPVVAEITSFPDTPNDDMVDCMTIALQHLCLRSPIAALITDDILRMARQ